MAETVLQVVREVSKRIGLGDLTTVYSNGDDGVQQLLALFNEVGQEAVERYRWQWTMRRATFNSIAQESQGNLETLLNVSLDMVSSCTIWDDTLRRPVYGPMTDQNYQVEKSFVGTGPFYNYKIMNNQLLINPVMPAGHSMSCIIRTKYWLVDQTQTVYRNTVGADTDILLLDADTAKLGLKAKWKAEKGLPYAEDLRSYETMLASRAAKTGTQRPLQLDGGSESTWQPGIVVPYGNWNV